MISKTKSDKAIGLLPGALALLASGSPGYMRVFQQSIKAIKKVLQCATYSSKDSLILIEANIKELLTKFFLNFLKLQT